MTSIRALSEQVRVVLVHTAERCARETGAVQRQRQFSGATLVQTLVFGWLANPAATLTELVQLAAGHGVRVSPQALHQRFSRPLAETLQQVLGALIQTAVVSTPAAIPLLERFTGIYILDSTTITLPDALAATWPGWGGQHGQGQAALKLQLQLELRCGTLVGPDLSAGRASDRACRLQQTSLPPGSLRLADLGYFALAVLRQLGEAGSYWLSRWQANTAILDPDGTRWEDIARGLTQRCGAQGVDAPILLGQHEQVPARLLAVRLPQAQADRRRAQLRRTAQRHGYTPRQATLALAAWALLVTNVPAEQLSLREALVLLRARWQIELLFKRWKSLGQLDCWRTTSPLRILCEVYAKLIGMLLTHWLVVLGCWQVPEHSLVKASRVVAQQARFLALTIAHHPAFLRTLRTLCATMTLACRLDRRRARPNAYQLWLDPSLAGLS